MKKWLLFGIAVLTVLIAAVLGKTAVDPEDITGEWYAADNQQIYRFHEGIIYNEKYSAVMADGGYISGAYCFSGKSVALFAMGVDGLDTTRELYLIENKEGSMLCEGRDGTGKIFFVRHN